VKLRKRRREWRREHDDWPYECEGCGEVLPWHREPNDVLDKLRKTKRYCSPACRQKAYRKRHRHEIVHHV
jgi:hypothetical protein